MVVGYVLVVGCAAVVVVIATASVPTVGQLGWLGYLTLGAIAHAEIVRRAEHHREADSGETTHTTTDTPWIFAAILLLPLPLVAALTVANLLHSCLRVAPRAPLHRSVFSVCTSVLASGAAALLIGFGSVELAQLMHDAGQVAWVLAAVVIRDVLALGLILPAVLLQGQRPALRSVIGTWSEHMYELGAAGFGVVIAVVLATAPAFLPVFVLQLVLLGYAARLPASERRARLDSKTGLLNPGSWQRVAARDLARAHRFRQPVAVLMIDIDRFKTVNDQHGHLAGDTALRAVAAAITAHCGTGGLAGRFGGEEFVIFQRDVEQAQLVTTAEELRESIASLAIGQPDEPIHLTVSVGAYRSTDPTDTLDHLVLAADNALFAAKHAGRNRSHVADPLTS